jgi:hypothetical protein
MQKKRNNFISTYMLEIIWIMIISIFGRLIPHVPNVTPLTGLGLFSGANLPRPLAIFVIFVSLFVSDICLSFILGYPIIGYFSLFTYTGFAAVVLIGSRMQYSKWSFPFYILGTSCFFWIWTNFGVWVTSGLYPRTLEGLGACYYLALPFLRNALIGDLIWSGIIFGAFYLLVEKNRGSEKGMAFLKIGQ